MLEAEVRKRLADDGWLTKARDALGLEHWAIDTRYERLDSGTGGRCVADPRYEHATISFDARQIGDESELAFLVRHELLHCVDSIHELTRQQAATILSDKEMWLFDKAHEYACERAVGAMERVLDRNGLAPLVIVGENENR